jgi:hypothetical protein
MCLRESRQPTRVEINTRRPLFTAADKGLEILKLDTPLPADFRTR